MNFSERPHVLHIIDSLAVGGAERMLVEIANQTDRARYQVSVCITRAGKDLASRLAVPLLELNRHSRFDWKGYVRLREILHGRHVDVVHAHGRSTFSFLALGRWLMVFQQPIILHDHEGIEMDATIPWWFPWAARSVLAQYVGVYPKLAQWAIRGCVPAERVRVIENAIDVQPFFNAQAMDLHARFGIGTGKKIGVVVGGIRREKGIDHLINAVSLLHSRANIQILIVGATRDADYLRLCQAKIAALSLESNFMFVGEQVNIPAILKGADYALMPSRSESGPLVLIEYLAAGLPIVAFRIGAIGQRAFEMDIPGMVAPGDIALFAHALDELLNQSTSILQDRGGLGEKLALEHFDIHTKMPQWYSVYDSVLKENGK